VLVVDQDRPGRDTLSTHALMRPGVVQLQRWGVLDAVVAAGTPPVRRVTFRYGDDIVPIDAAEPLYAPRRTVLDPILIAAAEDAGVRFDFGVRVDDVVRDAGGRVTGVRGRRRGGGPFAASAATTIGADGRNSLIARLVGARATNTRTASGAVLYGYWSGVAASAYEWCYEVGTSAGLIPTNDGLVCVWAGASPARLHDEMRTDRVAAVHRILAATNAEVAQRVIAGQQVGPIRGFAGLAGRMLRPWGPGWALVGDAGYFKDPLTAHGMSDALRDAELLARALDAVGSGQASEAAALSHYERVRDELSIALFDVTASVASYDWDLDELQIQHRLLSAAMKDETRVLLALDGTPLPAAVA
jgi:2-polyprenyl-6-methoxyphenol hydroxylase-like FAD-dependent oxidoreductase